MNLKYKYLAQSLSLSRYSRNDDGDDDDVKMLCF